MSTQARIGAGTQFQCGNGASPEVFTTLPEVLTIKFGGITVGTQKVTNQDSPQINGLIFEEYIGTLADGKEVDVTFNYRPADVTQQALQSSQDGKPHNFRIVVRDLTQSPIAILKTMSYSAFVTEWAIPDFPLEKQIEGTCKMKITGTVTFV